MRRDSSRNFPPSRRERTGSRALRRPRRPRRRRRTPLRPRRGSWLTRGAITARSWRRRRPRRWRQRRMRRWPRRRRRQTPRRSAPPRRRRSPPPQARRQGARPRRWRLLRLGRLGRPRRRLSSLARWTPAGDGLLGTLLVYSEGTARRTVVCGVKRVMYAYLFTHSRLESVYLSRE